MKTYFSILLLLLAVSVNAQNNWAYPAQIVVPSIRITNSPGVGWMLAAVDNAGNGVWTNAITVQTLNVSTANVNVINFTNSLLLTNIAKSAVTVAAGTNIVVITNINFANTTYTIHSTATGTGGGGGASVSGNSNQIVFINYTGTGLTNVNLPGMASPGFGFNPCATCGPGNTYGGFMVYANSPMGLVTFGHPNPASDFAVPTVAFVVSNRWATSTLFKNDAVKFETVEIGGGLSVTSTIARWRIWQDTASSNDVVEIFKTGEIKATGFTATNSLATNRLGETVFDNGMSFSSFASSVLTNILSTTTSLNFTAQSVGAIQDYAVYLPGVLPGDACTLGVPSVSATNIMGSFSAYASNNFVFVRFASTGTSQDPPAGTFRVMAHQFR